MNRSNRWAQFMNVARNGRFRNRKNRRASTVESLESRQLLSIHSVLNTSDAGPGSLRQAILDANTSASPAEILFAIPETDPGFVDVDSAMPGGDAEADVFRIQPLTALPAINNVNGHAVTVDAASQQDLSGETNPFGPEIELDGSIPEFAYGLQIQSDGVEVRGLTINRFSSIGILVQSDNVVLAGNFIGTDATGTTDQGNGWNGIEVRDAANNVVIGGTTAADRNVISGNAVNGIGIRGVTNLQISGNMIGTDASGKSLIRNDRAGISITTGNGLLIGGPTAAHRNILSGNGEQGLFASGSAVQNLTITSNYIGLNADGDTAVPNGGNGDSHGIRLERGASNIIIGAPDAGNVISGNLSNGIGDTHVENITIQSNIVGLDATGTFAIPNRGSGIAFSDARNALVGGTAPAERNIISGNRNASNNGDGVFLRGSDLRVIGNYIGTDITGTADVGNVGNGIGIDVVDHLEVSQNLVSGNDRAGIVLAGDASGVAVVRENLIGTNSDGSGGIPNDRPGIWLVQASGIDVIDNVSVGSLRSSGLIVDRSRDVTARGNKLGVLADGITAAPNDGFGLYVYRSYDLTIDDNTISGNRQTGVRVQESMFEPILVQWASTEGGNDHWYWVTPDRRDWEFHNAQAQSVGGNLADVADQSENDFLTDLVVNIAGWSGGWIGLNDAELEGTFSWTSGMAVDYTNWRPGQPNGGQRETGVVLWNNNQWYDEPDHIQHAGIVEFTTRPDPADLIEAYGNIHFTRNMVGSDANGVAAIPNADGFDISDSLSVIIGGPSAAEANVIAFNTNDGVHIRREANVTVSRNFIHSNGREGIDLAPQGPTVNDPLDADAGPNGLQNFPLIDSATFRATTTTISGTLQSTPNSVFKIELFDNSATVAADVEGEIFLGTVSATTDAAGNATFSLTVPVVILPGRLLTATATDVDGNTSEFSPAFVASPELTLSIEATTIAEDGVVTATITRNTDTSVDLDVMVLVDDQSELSVPMFVTIPAGSDSATFTISGVNDQIVDGTRTAQVSVMAEGHRPADVTLTVADVDSSQVSVAGILNGHEQGAVDGRFMVSLSTKAEHDVTVSYTVSGSAASGVDFTALTGEATIVAGQISAAIDVEVIDDFFAEITETVNVTLNTVTAVGDVSVDETQTSAGILLLNDDLNAIDVRPATVTVSESGSTATFAVKLKAQPTANVFISVISGDTSEATVSAATLVFTPGNWNVDQTVTVTGVDDAVADGAQNVDVTLAIAAGSAPEFRFAQAAVVNVLNEDNDAASAAQLSDVTLYNRDAVLEDGLSPDKTGQRSIIRHVQLVIDGLVNVPAGPVADGSFALTNVTTSNAVGLTVTSSTQVGNRTIVVLSFTSGTDPFAAGSLADGRYELQIQGGTLFDADNTGSVGGTRLVQFHRFFGDADGDGDVDNADYGRLFQAAFGNAAFQAAFDRDDDDDLFDELLGFRSHYGRRI